MKDFKVSEVHVSYKEKVNTSTTPQIVNSQSAADVLRQNWPGCIEMQETFTVLLLNKSNRVKGIYTVSVGGIDQTSVDIRILFGVVLKSLSCGIIISHNHPSGSLNPSNADDKLTKKIKKAAEMFEISLLDHIILSEHGYYSYADQQRL